MEEFLGSTHRVTPAGKRRPAGSHVPPWVNPRVYLQTKTNHSTYLGCNMFHSLPVNQIALFSNLVQNMQRLFLKTYQLSSSYCSFYFGAFPFCCFSFNCFLKSQTIWSNALHLKNLFVKNSNIFKIHINIVSLDKKDGKCHINWFVFCAILRNISIAITSIRKLI